MPKSLPNGPRNAKSIRHEPRSPANPKVLIVEDDPNMTKIFRILLETNGYEVITASYALPALFRVVRKEPDLILADLHMPMMNGLELLDQLKKHVETKDIPVVVVTGSTSPEDRAAAFAAGCNGYLTKPVDAKEFLQVIASLRTDSAPPRVGISVSSAANQTRTRL